MVAAPFAPVAYILSSFILQKYIWLLRRILPERGEDISRRDIHVRTDIRPYGNESLSPLSAVCGRIFAI
jgi:hypothetical protein